MAVDVDRLPGEDRAGELEGRHVGPPPGAVDGEEAEAGRRQGVKMRPGVAEAFGGLLGRGVERDLGIGLVRLTIGHVGIRAEDRGGRGEEEMADLGVPRRLDNVERPFDIGREIAARRFEAVAHARLRGEMDDGVGAEFGDVLRQPRGIFQHEFGKAETGVLHQAREAPALQADVVIIRHPVHAPDGDPFVQQEPGEVVADEPGRAADIDPHLSVSLARLPVLSAQIRPGQVHPSPNPGGAATKGGRRRGRHAAADPTYARSCDDRGRTYPCACVAHVGDEAVAGCSADGHQPDADGGLFGDVAGPYRGPLPA